MTAWPSAYTVPEQPSLKEVRILNEATQFRFSKFANLALISRGFETSNEDDYHELTIGGLHPEYLVNLPCSWKCRASPYTDGPNARHASKDSVLEKRRVDARTVLHLKLAPAGGSAMRLVPVR